MALSKGRMDDVVAALAPESWLVPLGGPRYLRLRQCLYAMIEDGILRENDPLPPERDIAAIADVSRVTVRKAIADLVRDGIMVQRHGSGSFVAPRRKRVEQPLSQLTSFSEDMARRGMQVTFTWLRRGIFPPSPQEMLTLGLPQDDQVARVERLRWANGEPLAIERTALPTSILPDPDLVTTSLYALLAEDGNRPVRAVQRIWAANVDEADAALLGVKAGEAGLCIERISFLATGRAAERTLSVYRGDAYDFVAEMTTA